MKRSKYILAVLSACFLSVMNTYAQQTINLKIDHMLGDEVFGMGTSASNSLGNDFKVSRLEFYISDIEILDTDGEYTAIPETWLLVRPEEGSSTTATLINLDDAINVEGIRFYIGVGPDVNHEDPSLYEASHPLAPKSPSMHWGWTSGYRFVAIEGNSGEEFASSFEFHALGDQNYFEAEINSAVETVGDVTTIVVKADYTQALSNIDMSSGVTIHGDYGDAERLLKNFRDYVFSTDLGLGIDTNVDASQIVIYPSHTTDGYFNISNPENNLVTIQVYNYSGQLIQKESVEDGVFQIHQKGLYNIVLLDSNGNQIGVKRVSVL